jgi:EAL domain-containing protein (putative c-di-GMP-specific phosphodiesterase class I)
MRFDVRVSIGYTRYPALALDADSLLRQVNMALDEAKRRGRAQSCEFEISIRQRITEREALEADIRQALIEEQFSVHYQPKIDIRSGAITGVEALVRWQHPRRGNVPPDAFIPLCEECGLVVPLGEWVLQRACRDAQRWQSLGLPPLSVAVNISAAQMQSHILLDTVHGALAASGLRPELLELEITESAMMEDPEEVIVLVRSLHDLGIQLAIDDFGTGYSSLTYLKRFPVNTLKIDKSFVDDVTCDRDDAAIVGAVIDLGQHFALKIVAEGVEDEAQLAFLAARGCDIAQGYFYSRPLPNGALIEWVREHETQRAKAADASDAAQR